MQWNSQSREIASHAAAIHRIRTPSDRWPGTIGWEFPIEPVSFQKSSGDNLLGSPKCILTASYFFVEYVAWVAQRRCKGFVDACWVCLYVSIFWQVDLHSHCAHAKRQDNLGMCFKDYLADLLFNKYEYYTCLYVYVDTWFVRFLQPVAQDEKVL